MPVFVARQDVDIQRRLALFAGCFNAGGEIHLQRMVVQHYFLGMGNQRGKAQVIAQRVIGGQLAQTFSAAVIQIFQPGEQ